MPRKKKSETENEMKKETENEEKKEYIVETEKAAEVKEEKPKKERKSRKKEEKSEEKLEEVKEEIKEEIKEAKAEEKREEKPVEKIEKKDLRNIGTLIPLEDYVKYSAHLGKRVVTPGMRQFVYKRRADGLAVIKTEDIDKRLQQAIDFILKYDLKDVIVVCKREAGWAAAKIFSDLTGIRVFTKKYPAGIITNINLPDFFEPELIFVCDSWLDRNALKDALRINKKIVALCDTNNPTQDIDLVVPCNNKNAKALGIVFYLLTREILKRKGIEKTLPPIEDFVGKGE
jgi:small subunit ribosomal protein S2